MGDPAASVAWLANALAGSGEALPAGSIVLTGSVAPPVGARPGDAFTVEFDRLGSVSVSFAPEGTPAASTARAARDERGA
jgi:2-keto-4-pentenoate hydratase